MAAEASLLSEGDVATDLLLGIDPQEGSLVCKFNINVMPGKMSKAWCVVDVKRWKMMATCCGDLDACAIACHQALVEWGRQRPFVYVTLNGEPPECDSPPFTGMPSTCFIADCDPKVLCDLCKLPGVRALEIRKQRTAPVGYRVRILHDGSVPSDPSLYIDPAALYDMGRARAGSKASKKNKKKKALPSEEVMAEYAAAAELANRQNEEYISRSTAEVAALLEETDTETLSRAVRYAGMDIVTQVVQQTNEIEAGGGMMTADGSRRCTKGGVFLKLLKMWLNEEQFMLIYQKAYEPNSFSPPANMPNIPLDGAPLLTMTSAAVPITMKPASETGVEFSTSLGASPPQNLLEGSLGSSLSGSFDPHAKVFIPGGAKTKAQGDKPATQDDRGADAEPVALDIVDDDMADTFVMDQ